jgi:phytanoyl-CoA hydroxylase
MNEKEKQNELKADFDRDGYVFIPGFLKGEALQELLNNIDRYLETVVPKMPRESVYYEDINRPETLKQIQGLHRHDNYFENMYYGNRFEELAEVLFGGPVSKEGNNFQYFNKPPKDGLPTPPHQDGYYFKIEPCEALTMWLALEEVDEENGCVRYVKGSHQRGMRPHGRSGTLGFSQGITDFGTEEDKANEIKFHAQAGDLLVHQAMMIHLAGANTSATRTRKAIGLIYYSQRAKVDHEAKAAHQRKMTEDLKAAGKI